MVKEWILSVTAAAAAAAIAESITPKGSVRKIVRLLGGLVLTVAMLQPVLRLDGETLRGILTRYRVEAGVADMDIGIDNMRIMKSVIEEQTGAYILDKAESLGIHCEVAVTAQVQDGAELPVPYCVTVTGTFTQEQREALTRRVESDLAIAPERQTYLGKDREE